MKFNTVESGTSRCLSSFLAAGVISAQVRAANIYGDQGRQGALLPRHGHAQRQRRPQTRSMMPRANSAFSACRQEATASGQPQGFSTVTYPNIVSVGRNTTIGSRFRRGEDVIR